MHLCGGVPGGAGISGTVLDLGVQRPAHRGGDGEGRHGGVRRVLRPADQPPVRGGWGLHPAGRRGAVLGNDEVIASCVGEIKPADEFYSYDAKYQNEASKTIIPADLDERISEEIRKLAIKAFKAIDGKGLSRVDFFVEDKTNQIYINEINTLPGFTKISMYPKLFEAVGIQYHELLDKLIDLAQE